VTRPGRPRSALDWLIDALALVAGAMLCILTVLVCLDVASRTLRLFAMPWTLDVTEYLLYAITFLAAPWVLREQGHIAIEIVVERLPRRTRSVLQRVTDAFGAAVCSVLFVFACRVLWRSYSQNNVVHETFVFPEWYLFTLAPPVFLILAVEFVLRAARPDDPSRAARRQSV
jgi:TRAP-type C4-dicarboxylate transport system permease small subunit